nr:uncharacterized protein LOC129382847 [Dermacentor andersoni]
MLVFVDSSPGVSRRLPSGGLLSSARRVLSGPDGVARTPSPSLHVLTKRLDAFPSERWLPAVLPACVPLGETLPCFADKHGCLVAEPATGRCRQAAAFEYLAQSRGTRYRWHQLSESQATGAKLFYGIFSEVAPAVIVGHGASDQWLLAARASHYGLLVMGYLAVDRLGSVVGGGQVIGCDPRGAHDAPLVAARHDVRGMNSYSLGWQTGGWPCHWLRFAWIQTAHAFLASPSDFRRAVLVKPSTLTQWNKLSNSLSR